MTQVNRMSAMRDYDKESKDASTHRYAYSFDFEVMHPFMIKACKPFFRKGPALELGSFRGDFTKRLAPYFDDITCVEASDNAVAAASGALGSAVKIIKATFETVKLDQKYENIFLTH